MAREASFHFTHPWCLATLAQVGAPETHTHRERHRTDLRQLCPCYPWRGRQLLVACDRDAAHMRPAATRIEGTDWSLEIKMI